MDPALYDLETLVLSSYKTQSVKVAYAASTAYLNYVCARVIEMQFLLPREPEKHSSPFEDHNRQATVAAYVQYIVNLTGCSPSQITYVQLLPSLKGAEYMVIRASLRGADEDTLSASQILRKLRQAVVTSNSQEQNKGLLLKNILGKGEQEASVDMEYGSKEGRIVCDLTSDNRRYFACVKGPSSSVLLATLLFWCKYDSNQLKMNTLYIIKYLAAEDKRLSKIKGSDVSNHFAFGRRIVEDYRGLGLISGMVGSSNNSIRKLACQVLTEMSAYSIASRLIVMSSTVRNLIRMLGSTVMESTIAAAETLASLSRSIENRCDLASMNNLVSACILIDSIQDVEFQGHLAELLANLCTEKMFIRSILCQGRENFVKFITSLRKEYKLENINDTSNNSKRRLFLEITKFFGNVLVHCVIENHIDEDSRVFLFRTLFVDSKDFISSLISALKGIIGFNGPCFTMTDLPYDDHGLSHQFPDTSPIIVLQHVCRALWHLCQYSTHLSPHAGVSIVNTHNILPYLFTLIRHDSFPGVSHEHRRKLRYWALQTIATMSNVLATHPEIVTFNLTALISTAVNVIEDSGLSLIAVTILARLALNDDNKSILIPAGVLVPLISWARGKGNIDAQRMSKKALTNLGVDVMLREDAETENGEDAMNRSDDNSNENIGQSRLQNISTLGIHELISLMDSSVTEIQLYASKALANVSLDSSKLIGIIELNGIEKLFRLLRSPNVAIQCNAARGLCNLSVADDGLPLPKINAELRQVEEEMEKLEKQILFKKSTTKESREERLALIHARDQLFLKRDIHRKERKLKLLKIEIFSKNINELMQLIHGTSQQLTYYCAATIANLFMFPLVKLGANLKSIYAAMERLQSTSLDITTSVLRGLFNNTLRNEGFVKSMLEINGVPFLVSCIDREDINIQRISLGIIANICRHSSYRKDILNNIGLQTLFLIIEKRKTVVKEQAARCIGYLAEDRSNAILISELGGDESLIKFGISAISLSARLEAMKALINLMHVSSLRPRLVKKSILRMIYIVVLAPSPLYSSCTSFNVSSEDHGYQAPLSSVVFNNILAYYRTLLQVIRFFKALGPKSDEGIFEFYKLGGVTPILRLSVLPLPSSRLYHGNSRRNSEMNSEIFELAMQLRIAAVHDLCSLLMQVDQDVSPFFEIVLPKIAKYCNLRRGSTPALQLRVLQMLSTMIIDADYSDTVVKILDQYAKNDLLELVLYPLPEEKVEPCIERVAESFEVIVRGRRIKRERFRVMDELKTCIKIIFEQLNVASLEDETWDPEFRRSIPEWRGMIMFQSGNFNREDASLEYSTLQDEKNVIVKDKGEIEDSLILLHAKLFDMEVRALKEDSIHYKTGIAAGLTKLYVIKVVVVGSARCGKTSLVYRFLNNTKPGDLPETVGCEYSSKTVRKYGDSSDIATLSMPKIVVRLQIMDISGNDRVLENPPMSFFQDVKGALVIFDSSNTLEGRRSFQVALEWQNILQQKAIIKSPLSEEPLSVPSVLVAHRCEVEERSAFIKSTTKLEKICHDNNFANWAESSAMTGVGLDSSQTVFDTLIDEILTFSVKNNVNVGNIQFSE